MRFNGIRSDGAEYISSALLHNKNLRFLCLSCNELCDLDEDGDGTYNISGISAISKALYVNSSLKILKLAENDINNEGAMLLANALCVNTALSVLDLHGNILFQEAETLWDEKYDKYKAPSQVIYPCSTTEGGRGKILAPLFRDGRADGDEDGDGDGGGSDHGGKGNISSNISISIEGNIHVKNNNTNHNDSVSNNGGGVSNIRNPNDDDEYDGDGNGYIRQCEERSDVQADQIRHEDIVSRSTPRGGGGVLNGRDESHGGEDGGVVEGGGGEKTLGGESSDEPQAFSSPSTNVHNDSIVTVDLNTPCADPSGSPRYPSPPSPSPPSSGRAGHVQAKEESNEAGIDGGVALLHAIAQSNYLTAVDLSWTFLGCRGIMLFSRVMTQRETCSALTYINLSGNMLYDEGIQALAKMIKFGDNYNEQNNQISICRNLHTLILQNVKMTSDGIAVLGSALGSNKRYFNT